MSQLVPAKEKVKSIRDLLERSKAQIQMALPKHMTSERMLRIAMTEVQKTPALLNCQPQTLVAAVIQASQLGLEIGVLGQAYLVPYKDQCQLIPGYRGLIQLARRSGEIINIEARVVHEKDEFEVGYGLDAKLRHIPNLKDTDPGPVVAAYAFATLKGGGYHFEVMSVRELDAIRRRSKASSNGPWVTDTEEMYRKTVARRLCKWLPSSIELMTALDLENKADAGLPQDIDVIDVPAEEVTEPAKPLPGRLAAVTASLSEQREAGMEG